MVARQNHDLGAFADQHFCQPRTQKPCAAGDQNVSLPPEILCHINLPDPPRHLARLPYAVQFIDVFPRVHARPKSFVLVQRKLALFGQSLHRFILENTTVVILQIVEDGIFTDKKPAGNNTRVNREKKNTGIHSDTFPIFDVPIKSPMTTKTVGVTEALIMSMDFKTTLGIAISKPPTRSPKITESKRGFFVKFLSMFLTTSCLFKE